MHAELDMPDEDDIDDDLPMLDEPAESVAVDLVADEPPQKKVPAASKPSTEAHETVPDDWQFTVRDDIERPTQKYKQSARVSLIDRVPFGDLEVGQCLTFPIQKDKAMDRQRSNITTLFRRWAIAYSVPGWRARTAIVTDDGVEVIALFRTL